jgi:hypothetical protein
VDCEAPHPEPVRPFNVNLTPSCPSFNQIRPPFCLSVKPSFNQICPPVSLSLKPSFNQIRPPVCLSHLQSGDKQDVRKNAAPVEGIGRQEQVERQEPQVQLHSQATLFSIAFWVSKPKPCS